MTDPAKIAFVAGATGAIGRPLCRLLVADGWTVFGTTRRADRAAELSALGVTPVIVDVFDADALRDAMVAARPSVVIHQLTDLPAGLDPTRMPAARERNTRLRDEGTRNLVAAAIAAGASRIVAQSIAFAYAPGPKPLTETAPLDPNAFGVRSLEAQVIGSPLASVVLRYGHLYGPGTGFDAAPKDGPVHVDAAARAALLAMTAGAGVYNVAESDGTLAIERAVAELGWRPEFRP